MTRAGRSPARRLGYAGLLAVLLSGACGTSPPAATTTVRFGLIQAVDQLPFWVMQEQGFARRHGVKLVEQIVPGGTALIDGLAAGTLDAGYAGSLPMLLAARAGTVPDQVVGVAGVSFNDAAHPLFAVVAGPGVEGWADLAGRDVAVNNPDSIGGVAIRLRLRAEGVAGTRLVSVPFPNQGLAVAGGNVAAAVIVEPFVTQSLLRGDGRVLAWIVGGGEPFPDFQASLLAVPVAWTRQRPADVKALLAAQLDAVRWIAGHDREARAIVARRLGTTEEVGRALRMTRFAPDARNDQKLLSDTQAELHSLEPAGSSPPPIERLYDETLLDQVLRARQGS